MRGFANTAGQELTFTCVPPGSGGRIGIDRDGDGYGDSDETDAGSDPDDPGSIPPSGAQVCTSSTAFIFSKATLKDSRGTLSLTAKDVPLVDYNQEAVGTVAVDGGGTIYAGAIAGPSILPKGSGFKYTAPSGSTGLTRITVKESRRSPGLFKITLKTKLAWTPGLANETEATTDVTLNVGGKCFVGDATRVRP
jgi:hypothetical protein